MNSRDKRIWEHGQGITYERRLLALFLGSKKLPQSLDIVKDEAIVDAPWVSVCVYQSQSYKIEEVFCISLLRGVIYHCSFYYIGLW